MHPRPKLIVPAVQHARPAPENDLIACSTIAIHIAVALMKIGQRLATIDLDSRQRTLTHYIENRRAWACRRHVDLELPTHLTIAYAEGARVDENEAAEFADFAKAVAAIEH